MPDMTDFEFKNEDKHDLGPDSDRHQAIENNVLYLYSGYIKQYGSQHRFKRKAYMNMHINYTWYYNKFHFKIAFKNYNK